MKSILSLIAFVLSMAISRAYALPTANPAALDQSPVAATNPGEAVISWEYETKILSVADGELPEWSPTFRGRVQARSEREAKQEAFRAGTVTISPYRRILGATVSVTALH